MADEPQLHDLTKLLLKRLESNPEEFSRIKLSADREWFETIEVVREHGTNLDRDTLNAALDKFHMDDTLEGALKGLLNGDENEAAKGVGLRPGVAGVQGSPTGSASNYGGGGGTAMGGGGNGGDFGFNPLQNIQPRQVTYEEMLAEVRAQMSPLGVPTTTALTTYGQIKKRLGL